MEAASSVLADYVTRSGNAGTMQSEIVDLIADLLHLAEGQGLDILDILQNAHEHFRAETAMSVRAPHRSAAR
jgi:hypothetical protein